MSQFVGQISRGGQVILEQINGSMDGPLESCEGTFSLPAGVIQMNDICQLEIKGGKSIKILIENVQFKDGVGTATFTSTPDSRGNLHYGIVPRRGVGPTPPVPH
jgi:hypothetical protein